MGRKDVVVSGESVSSPCLCPCRCRRRGMSALHTKTLYVRHARGRIHLLTEPKHGVPQENVVASGPTAITVTCHYFPQQNRLRTPPPTPGRRGVVCGVDTCGISPSFCGAVVNCCPKPARPVCDGTHVVTTIHDHLAAAAAAATDESHLSPVEQAQIICKNYIIKTLKTIVKSGQQG